MKTPVPESLFLIKLQAAGCNFIEKETLAQVFSCEFCEISKNTFFAEHFRATTAAMIQSVYVCNFAFCDFNKGFFIL